jgi:hypothetical protein
MDFNVNQGAMTPHDMPEFSLALPNPGKNLNLLEKGHLLGAIPLNSLVQHLLKYDFSGRQRNLVPSEDMVFEYENKEVAVIVNFNNVMMKIIDGKMVLQGGSGEMLVRLKNNS